MPRSASAWRNQPAVVAAVAEHHLGGRQGIDHHGRAFVIAGLALSISNNGDSALIDFTHAR
jgi:hypothetical protein